MTAFFLRRLLHRKFGWAVIAVIIACRLQETVSSHLDPSYPAAVSRIIDYFNTSLLSLLLPLLYCFWIYDSCQLFHDVKIVLRIGSRSKLAAAFGLCAAIDSASFLLILCLSSIPIVIARSGNISAYMGYLSLTFLLLLLFFIVCSLLYFAVYMLTAKSYSGFLAVAFYGAWDMVISMVARRFPYIGSFNGLLDYNPFRKSPALFLSSLRISSAEILLLCLACALICWKVDFIDKHEEKNDE